jgi:hypothetical protein
MYQEEVIVEDLNLLLGSSLHLQDGTLVMRNVYKYRHHPQDDLWLPEISYHEEFLQDEVTGSTITKKTTNFYDNFKIREIN